MKYAFYLVNMNPCQNVVSFVENLSILGELMPGDSSITPTTTHNPYSTTHNALMGVTEDTERHFTFVTPATTSNPQPICNTYNPNDSHCESTKLLLVIQTTNHEFFTDLKQVLLLIWNVVPMSKYGPFS